MILTWMGDGVKHAKHEQRIARAEYVSSLDDQIPERRFDLVIPVVPRGVQRHHDHLWRRQRRRHHGRRRGLALRGGVGRPRRRGGGLVVPGADDGGHRHRRPQRGPEGAGPPPPLAMPMPMQAPPAAAAAIVAARNRGYEGLEAPTRRRVYSGDYSVHSILLQARGAPRGRRRRIYPPLAQALTAT